MFGIFNKIKDLQNQVDNQNKDIEALKKYIINLKKANMILELKFNNKPKYEEGQTVKGVGKVTSVLFFSNHSGCGYYEFGYDYHFDNGSVLTDTLMHSYYIG